MLLDMRIIMAPEDRYEEEFINWFQKDNEDFGMLIMTFRMMTILMTMTMMMMVMTMMMTMMIVMTMMIMLAIKTRDGHAPLFSNAHWCAYPHIGAYMW